MSKNQSSIPGSTWGLGAIMRKLWPNDKGQLVFLTLLPRNTTWIRVLRARVSLDQPKSKKTSSSGKRSLITLTIPQARQDAKNTKLLSIHYPKKDNLFSKCAPWGAFWGGGTETQVMRVASLKKSVKMPDTFPVPTYSSWAVSSQTLFFLLQPRTIQKGKLPPNVRDKSGKQWNRCTHRISRTDRVGSVCLDDSRVFWSASWENLQNQNAFVSGLENRVYIGPIVPFRTFFSASLATDP